MSDNMKNNKTTQIAVRLQPEEKRQLFYFATRLGISPSALVRNQIKTMLQELEEKVKDGYYSNIADMAILEGPKYEQEEIEKMFKPE
jgi:predicted DNA-binding protein